MIVSLWGKERRMEQARFRMRQEHTCIAREKLFSCDLSMLDALILPLHGVQGSKGDYMEREHLELPENFWSCLREDCRIITGRSTTFLDGLPQPKYCYLEDETFLRQNALLTAQGTLYYLLDQLDHALHDCHVDIIGKGRCGEAIGAMLEKLDVRVRYVRHGEAQGETEIAYADWKQQKCAEIIIQTAPAVLLEEEMLQRWQGKTRIIDIASHRTVEERLVHRLGIPYVKAGNIPEQFAWRSGGDLIYQYAKKVLHGA